MQLRPEDLQFVVRRLPKDVRQIMQGKKARVILAGGFIRAVIAGEDVADIDLFSSCRQSAADLTEQVKRRRPDAYLHSTVNADTIVSIGRLPVQVIKRWTYARPEDVVADLDFTVCQAAVWFGSKGEWESSCSEAFYFDLAARRLVYTAPQRDEEVGGTMLRVLKYLKRGYSIQVPALAAVISRLTYKARDSEMASSEEGFAQVVTGLLREVDPLTAHDIVEGNQHDV